jgi:hypothetical protein
MTRESSLVVSYPNCGPNASACERSLAKGAGSAIRELQPAPAWSLGEQLGDFGHGDEQSSTSGDKGDEAMVAIEPG